MELRTLPALIVTQYKNVFCEHSRALAVIPDSEFKFDESENHVRKGPIDGSIQKLCQLRAEFKYYIWHFIQL